MDSSILPKRFGVNISGQNFYDSGQVLRNLTFRNPGFEGETWQSIFQCQTVTPTTCTDGNKYDQWPADFVKGAHFEFITGSSRGINGTVISSTKSGASNPNLGITIRFANPGKAPVAGDFVLVRAAFPGDPIAGWWADAANSGATFTPEFTDLSPKSPGKQALRISAAGAGQSASLHSYFDSASTTASARSFVQLHGSYVLTFRAKGAGGNKELTVSLTRIGTAAGNEALLPPVIVPLTDNWKDYSYRFTASENDHAFGTLDLNFVVKSANVLLDDVSLGKPFTKENPTAFRDEVVQTLQTLHPGVLRYMDSGTSFGSSIDNMIAPSFARERTGYSLLTVKQEDTPIGLQEFLQLCKTVGAEPWYSMPAGISPEEARNLIEYLAGPPTSPYGAKRATSGQVEPWASVFPKLHLELGNEQWNSRSFYGGSISKPVAYGQRTADVFAGARSSPSYTPGKFDLIMGTFAVLPWWTEQELSSSSHYDSTAAGPYLFNNLDDATSNEAIFGPMFAQPEMIDSRPSGYMTQQAKSARTAKQSAALNVYEVNLSTLSGTVSQDVVNSVVPSLGAGLAVADHMLLMMRDLGITTQAVWALGQYSNGFSNSSPGAPHEDAPLFGMVVDMGGSTNLRRPLFLSTELANEAILPALRHVDLSGGNPTWNQKLSKNDKIELKNAHYIQAFAFSDDHRRSLIVFNLSRDQSLPITFSGANAPSGAVQLSSLTSKNITDSNEVSSKVTIHRSSIAAFNPAAQNFIPPFSMTVLKWTDGVQAPPKPKHGTR